MAQALEPTSASDVQLLQRYLAGNDDAFAELLERYRKPLFGFLVKFTGDRALAEDVFQETFLQVHHSAATVDPDRPLKPWLYTVAANKARDALRKKTRHPAAPLDARLGGDEPTTYADLMPADIPSPEEFLSNQETCQAVQQLIAELPGPLREVLALSYLKELPQKEIAGILEIPVGTVKSRLHAAVRAFAAKWQVWAARQGREGTESSP